MNPTQKINRRQLTAEIEVLSAQAKSSYSNLDQQDKLKQLLFQQSLIAAQGLPINPVAVMIAAGSILGLGATVDNVRKRKEIKTLKNP